MHSASNTRPWLARTRWAVLPLLMFATANTLAAPARAEPSIVVPATIVLPGATSAEGIAAGHGTTFYAGDLFSGDIFRGDIAHGTAELFIDVPDGRQAVGMAVSRPRPAVRRRWLHRTGVRLRHRHRCDRGHLSVRRSGDRSDQRRGRHQARRLVHRLPPGPALLRAGRRLRRAGAVQHAGAQRSGRRHRRRVQPQRHPGHRRRQDPDRRALRQRRALHRQPGRPVPAR